MVATGVYQADDERLATQITQMKRLAPGVSERVVADGSADRPLAERQRRVAIVVLLPGSRSRRHPKHQRRAERS
jgi:hypothetical protein